MSTKRDEVGVVPGRERGQVKMQKNFKVIIKVCHKF